MPEYAADLAAAYAAQGESVTVAGTAVTCFFNTGYADALGVATNARALRCISTSISHAAIGDTVTRSAIDYTIRGIEAIPPDGLETVIVLEAA